MQGEELPCFSKDCSAKKTNSALFLFLFFTALNEVYQLDPVSDIGLLIDPINVVFDRLQRDEESIADLFICFSFTELLDDLLFTFGNAVLLEKLSHCSGFGFMMS